MSQKSRKQFGVWIDKNHATIVGRTNIETDEFSIIANVKSNGPDNNSSEKASNNQEITLTHKFFKEIASNMQNIDEILVTGTGQIQEEFIKFLAETPQYKNAKSSENTSNKMGDEKLISFVTEHFK